MLREITSNRELKVYLQKLYPDFDTHVIPIDGLNNISPKMKQIIIINFKRAHSSGTHWVAVIAREKKYVLYFDSYGLDAPEPILTFMRQYKEKGLVNNLIMNIRKIQPIKGKGSNACGYFIMKFLEEYIKKDQPVYEAVVKVNTKNTLEYGRKLYRKFFYWLKNVNNQ